MADSEKQIKHVLELIQKHGCVEDSGALAEELGVQHPVLVGYIKSLESTECVLTEVRFTVLHRETHGHAAMLLMTVDAASTHALHVHYAFRQSHTAA
jgi:hypothetical protein